MEAWYAAFKGQWRIFKAGWRGTHSNLQRALMFGASVTNAIMLWCGQSWATPVPGFVRTVPRGVTPHAGAVVVSAVRPHRLDETDYSLMTPGLAGGLERW